MTMNICIHYSALAFLDRGDVVYSNVQQGERFEEIVTIDLEITASNLVSYGIAREKYGASQVMNQLGMCKVDLIKVS